MAGTSQATAQVLQTIRNEKVVSRAHIARVTGLSIATVSEKVETLLRQRLVIEVGRGTSSGGRRPQLVSFNRLAGYILAIDLGATSVDVGVTDLDTNIIASVEKDVDVAAGPEPVLCAIRDIANELLTSLGIDRERVVGIGMGVPGPVEFNTGMLSSPPIMPGWDRYPIRGFWVEEFDCPCYVDNDVNIMAIGEHTQGVGRGVENLIFVKVGTGIGAGIICNGSIYRGSQGCAGDLGHIDVGEDVLCWCGNTGCLEAIAGGQGIAWRAKQLAQEGRSAFLAEVLAEKGTLTAEDVGFAAAHTDAASVELIRESGTLIGRAVATMVSLFNPSLIVIGGGVARIGDSLLASIRQTVYHRSPPLATRELAIKNSSLRDQAGMIGAAAMTVEQLLLEPVANLATTRPAAARTLTG